MLQDLKIAEDKDYALSDGEWEYIAQNDPGAIVLQDIPGMINPVVISWMWRDMDIHFETLSDFIIWRCKEVGPSDLLVELGYSSITDLGELLADVMDNEGNGESMVTMIIKESYGYTTADNYYESHF